MCPEELICSSHLLCQYISLWPDSRYFQAFPLICQRGKCYWTFCRARRRKGKRNFLVYILLAEFIARVISIHKRWVTPLALRKVPGLSIAAGGSWMGGHLWRLRTLIVAATTSSGRRTKDSGRAGGLWVLPDFLRSTYNEAFADARMRTATPFRPIAELLAKPTLLCNYKPSV